MRRDLRNTGGEGGPRQTDAQVRKRRANRIRLPVVHAVNDVYLEVVPLRRLPELTRYRPPGSTAARLKLAEFDGARTSGGAWFT